MTIVKLKESMLAYQRRTGEKITYEDLAELTGLSAGTVQSIATREKYHPTLANVEKLCLALEATPGEMLEIVQSFPATSE